MNGTRFVKNVNTCVKRKVMILEIENVKFVKMLNFMVIKRKKHVLNMMLGKSVVIPKSKNTAQNNRKKNIVNIKI